MDLFRFDPPELTDADARRIADDLYGLTGRTQRLRGERSHNTRFTTADGDAFVLRVASASEPDAAIDCHAEALVHLERSAPQLPIARMRAARNGQLVPDGGDRRARAPGAARDVPAGDHLRRAAGHFEHGADRDRGAAGRGCGGPGRLRSSRRLGASCRGTSPTGWCSTRRSTTPFRTMPGSWPAAPNPD